MANMGVAVASRSSAAPGKHSLLPPRYPMPPVSSSFADCGSKGSKGIPRSKDSQRHHQRTSSESFLFEEQPSWLDDLLSEPETPAGKAHRRSTSDSFAFLDGVSLSDIGYVGQGQVNIFNYPSSKLVEKGTTFHGGAYLMEPDVLKPDTSVKNEQVDSVKNEQVDSVPDTRSPLETKEAFLSKQTDADSKRVKQQYAQRSRVRKLQYIAELENHVQALQAEGLEVSAELEFLDQQNLVLNLENNALKQRLDILAQEKLIKHFQQEMLEREIARLRMLYQRQQMQQQLQENFCPTHSRSSSRDLNSQLANLSLRNNEKSPGCEPMIGPLDI